MKYKKPQTLTSETAKKCGWCRKTIEPNSLYSIAKNSENKKVDVHTSGYNSCHYRMMAIKGSVRRSLGRSWVK